MRRKMVERIHREGPLLPAIPLLSTDCREEFDRILRALNQEIKPRGTMEKILTEDVAYNTFEIQRMRRYKVGIISAEFRAALEGILDRLMREPGDSRQVYIGNAMRAEAESLAKEWFTDQEAKERVSELLRQFQLDESVIEAEAFRNSVADIEKLDRLLASAEARRNSALRQISKYRDVFAQRLRDSSDRIIEGKALTIEHAEGKASSAAA
jgi:hypothetical protein